MIIARRQLVMTLGGMVCWPYTAVAQQPNMAIIGWLSSVSPRASDPLLKAFRGGLAEQGYSEGRNLWIYYRWAEGHYDELETLAKDLIEKKVVLIAAAGGVVSAQAAKKATSQIPILFVSGFDPVVLGLVTSMNNPGVNATGVSVYTTELIKKRVQLLHEMTPTANTLAVLTNPNAIVTKIEIQDIVDAAKFLGVTPILFNATTETEVEQAFASAAQQHVGAVIVSADPFFTSRRAQIVALAAQHSLPTCYPWREYVEAGGLLSYGPDLTWAFRQLGIYAGRIIKGAKATDLPVQQPTSFKLAINVKTARALGLTLPSALQATADEVIE